MHSYEKEYFEKILSLLEQNTRETGKLHQVDIIISKFEFDEQPDFEQLKRQTLDGNEEPSNSTNSRSTFVRKGVKIIEEDNDDEIRTGGIKASTKAELSKNVEELDGQKFKIIKYSSYSRICNKNSSDELKNIVLTKGFPPEKNFEFSLAWTVKDIDKKKNNAYFLSFQYKIAKVIVENSGAFQPQHRSRIEDLLANIKEVESRKKIVCFFLSDNVQEAIGYLKQLSNFTTAVCSAKPSKSLEKAEASKKENRYQPRIIEEDIRKILNDDTLMKIFLTNLSSNLTFPADYTKITAELLGSKTVKISKDKFKRFSMLLGHNSIHYQRLYYANIAKLDDKPFSSDKLSEISPDLSKYDSYLFHDPTLAVSKEFSDRVLMPRTKLWGDSAVANENFLVILNLVQGRHLKSLFEKINIKLPPELQSID